MCLPVMAVAQAAGTVAKFAGAHRAAGKENKARIKAFNLKKKNYLNNFNREVVAWQSDTIDNEIKIDEGFRDSMLKMAKNEVSMFNAIKGKSLAETEAFVAMQAATGGAHEQLGRRSKSSVSKLAGIRAYGKRMSDLAVKMSSAYDDYSMNVDILNSDYQKIVYDKNIDTLTGRPVAGRPPAAPKMKKGPSNASVIMQLAGDIIPGVMAAKAAGAAGKIGGNINLDSLKSGMGSGKALSPLNFGDSIKMGEKMNFGGGQWGDFGLGSSNNIASRGQRYSSGAGGSGQWISELTGTLARNFG